LEKEGLISELAKDITWNELAQKIKGNIEVTRRDFVDSALAATNEIAQTTFEMSRVLTGEVDRVVKETFRMTQKIRKMDDRLKEWDEVVEEMEDMAQDLKEERQYTSYQRGEAKNEFFRMEQEIEAELKHAEERRLELEKLIQDEIIKMQNASIRFKQRIRRM
jgi:chaperonin cofactor prefoldin